MVAETRITIMQVIVIVIYLLGSLCVLRQII